MNRVCLLNMLKYNMSKLFKLSQLPEELKLVKVSKTSIFSTRFALKRQSTAASV